MVVGESGLGKSTLINSLFLSDLYRDRKIPEVHGKHCTIPARYYPLIIIFYMTKIFYPRTLRDYTPLRYIP